MSENILKSVLEENLRHLQFPTSNIRTEVVEGGFIWMIIVTPNNVWQATGTVPLFDTDDVAEIATMYNRMVCFDMLLCIVPRGPSIATFLDILSRFPPKPEDGEIEMFIKATLTEMKRMGIKKGAARRFLLDNNHVDWNIDAIWRKQ